MSAVLDALRKKVQASVGLAPEGDVGFTTDLKKANERAKATREIQLFENRMAGMLGAQGCEGEDSDLEDAEEGRELVPAGIAQVDLSWSDEASELDFLARNKKTRKYGKLDNVVSFLKTLRLQECGIKRMEPGVLNFVELRKLNLSGNDIKEVRHIPQNLAVLDAFDNAIESLDFSDSPGCKKLFHLGLGFNRLRELSEWTTLCCNLQSLDVSFNLISSLEDILPGARKLKRLKSLCVFGNPLCLLPGYRRQVIAALPSLEVLDDIPVQISEREEIEVEASALSTVVTAEISIQQLRLQPPPPARPESDASDETTREGDPTETKKPEGADEGNESTQDEKEAVETPELVRKAFVCIEVSLDNLSDPLAKSEEVEVVVPQEDEKTADADEKAGLEIDDQKQGQVVALNFSRSLQLEATPNLRDAFEEQGMSFSVVLREKAFKEVVNTELTESPEADEDHAQRELELESESTQVLSRGKIDLSAVLDPANPDARLELRDLEVHATHPDAEFFEAVAADELFQTKAEPVLEQLRSRRMLFDRECELLVSLSINAPIPFTSVKDVE